MIQSLQLLLTAVVALAVGASFTLLLVRSRIAMAAERARSDAATELAVAGESIRQQAEERERLMTRLEGLQAESDRWRAALDETSNERAQLGERASRVAPLEARIEGLDQALSEANRLAADAREALGRVQAELQAERESHASTSRRAEGEKASREAADATVARLNTELAQLGAQQAAEREQFTEKLAFIEEAKRSLTDQFKNLANDILEEKGRRFAEQNQTNLGTLLDPLKQKLNEFQAKVNDVYVNETKDRTALAEQVRQLMGLNQTLSDEAKNLTSALKGSNKSQGNYGELVLERVLESSGLRRGHEYRYQESLDRVDGEGQRYQPDIIITLPEDRSLVVDSKMTLTAYEAYANAEDESVRKAALKAHLGSVRSHIKGLSSKNYQQLHQLESLDFVLMFVPLEPAFMAAVTNDNDLFMEAWNNNVLLVSPSTLLFVVRTVAHLWRQEAQTRNAKEIASRGADLYDRLTAFTQDLEMLGKRLNQAQDSFNDARNKLSRNKGNVIRQAEMLKELGVKPTKALSKSLCVAAAEDADEPLASSLLEVQA